MYGSDNMISVLVAVVLREGHNNTNICFPSRTMQVVQLDKHVKLLDSPGIVMATGKTDASTILKNCVKVLQLYAL